MAQITTSVSENGLDEVVKWYCTLENLKQANEAVLRFTRELKLRIHLKDDPDLTYTSSDGQKVEVAQDSLLARSSFKRSAVAVFWQSERRGGLQLYGRHPTLV